MFPDLDNYKNEHEELTGAINFLYSSLNIENVFITNVIAEDALNEPWKNKFNNLSIVNSVSDGFDG